MTEKTSQPFRVFCDACGHRWTAAYLPMEISLFAKIAGKAICPKCGGKAMVAFRRARQVRSHRPEVTP